MSFSSRGGAVADVQSWESFAVMVGSASGAVAWQRLGGWA